MKKGLILAALGALLVFAAPANAALVVPTFIAGNPSCEGGTKIEPVADGTFAVPGGSITIDVTGNSLAFDASGVTVFRVLVKGGPAANLYDYTALGGVDSDSGLVAPNGKGLSHFCFFTEPGEKPPPPPK